MFVSALSKRIEMTLVKSLSSADPDVIQKHADLQVPDVHSGVKLASSSG
jgi:hypothetical protein